MGEDRVGSGFLCRVSMDLMECDRVYDYIMYAIAFVLFYLAKC